MDNVPLNYWQKIQQIGILCTLSHASAGAVIAVFLHLGLTAAAGVAFTWFTIYECFQWLSKKDCPSQELGESLIGFIVAAIACHLISVL